MSDENSTRKYQQKLRAEQQDAMREKITVATMELHGTVGPANTTIKSVAERAGVQRATVYRYFPDDAALFEACSTHWLSIYPPPDIGQWMGEADPDARSLAGLTELYEYYGQTARMTSNLIRDESLHPAIPPLLASYWAYLDAAAGLLVKGRRLRGRRAKRALAAARLSVDFRTWQRLVERSGLSHREAAEVMCAAISDAGL